MRGDGAAGKPRAGSPDRALWRRCVAIDMAEDEAERFLDLAGYAEDRLDPDERDRIAERLAKDPIAAAVGIGLQLWIAGLAIWILGHTAAVWLTRTEPQFIGVFARHLRLRAPVLDA